MRGTDIRMSLDADSHIKKCQRRDVLRNVNLRWIVITVRDNSLVTPLGAVDIVNAGCRHYSRWKFETSLLNNSRGIFGGRIELKY
jgi:hypothetical protein